VTNREVFPWSADDISNEEKFGSISARLYYHIGENVDTPFGYGILRQVFGRIAGVAVQKGGRTKLIKIPMGDILPEFKNGKGETDCVLRGSFEVKA